MPTKDTELKKPEETVVKETAIKPVQSSPPWPLITIGIVATVLVAAVVVGGWWFVMRHGQTRNTRQAGQYGMMYGSNSSSQNGSYFGGRYRRGMMQSAAASGVIIAVNGQTLTVSGQGKQVTVTESSSTIISGDATSVAVNDTVLVYGTTNSDGSVTATQIVVRNSTPASGASSDETPQNTTAPGA